MHRQGLGVLFIILILENAIAQSPLEDAFLENRVVLISDFDNTLTGPAWKTLWYLKKIPGVQTWLQAAVAEKHGGFDRLPSEIPITEREFHDLAVEKIAVTEKNGEKTPRSFDTLVLPAIAGFAERSSNIEWLPGFYTVVDDTFRNFRSQYGRNQLLIDNERARQIETPAETRFGLTFPLFQRLASGEDSIGNIYIGTARQQEVRDFHELFASWQDEGVISKKTQVSEINVDPLGSGQAVLYGAGVVQRKVQRYRDHIINHYRLLAKQEDKKYFLVLGENDPPTVQALFEMLSELMTVKEFKKYIEVILIHADSDDLVRRSGLPSRFTTFRNGIAVVLDRESQDWIMTSSPKFKVRGPSVAATQSLRKSPLRVRCEVLFGGSL